MEMEMEMKMKCIVWDTLHYRLRCCAAPSLRCCAASLGAGFAFFRVFRVLCTAAAAAVIQLLSEFFNLSFHLFYFFYEECKHRNIIDGLVILRIFISNNEIREYFLDFVCDKTILVFVKEFVVIHNWSQPVECRNIWCG